MLPSPILVVCAGNVNRSPFAEAYLRQRLEEAGVYAEVFSRGLLDMGNKPPTETALRIAEEFGVDMTEHRTSRLTVDDLQRAALVLVMSPRQRNYVSNMYMPVVGKVFLLSQPEDSAEVPDPMDHPDEVFREVFGTIAHLVDLWLLRFGVSQTR